jgi:hypothetical protein
MKRPIIHIRRSSLLLPAVTVALSLGCGAKASVPGIDKGNVATANVAQAEADAPEPVKASPFSVVARALTAEPKEGAPMEFEITATNTSDSTAKLKFSSGWHFDFSATPEGATEPAWKWSTGRRFAQMLSSQEVEPGQSVSFKGTWPEPKLGTYTITSTLKANGGLPSPPFTITVK